jgi:hypothetical protein
MADYVRFEDLIGRIVRNSHGRPIGRIEELRVKPDGDEYVVSDFMIGPLARVPRLLGFLSQLPTLRALGIRRRQKFRPFRWNWIDLSDPMHPVVSSGHHNEV